MRVLFKGSLLMKKWANCDQGEGIVSIFMIHISWHPQDMHFHALICASVKDTAENRAGSCRLNGERKKERKKQSHFILPNILLNWFSKLP